MENPRRGIHTFRGPCICDLSPSLEGRGPLVATCMEEITIAYGVVMDHYLVAWRTHQRQQLERSVLPVYLYAMW